MPAPLSQLFCQDVAVTSAPRLIPSSCPLPFHFPFPHGLSHTLLSYWPSLSNTDVTLCQTCSMLFAASIVSPDPSTLWDIFVTQISVDLGSHHGEGERTVRKESLSSGTFKHVLFKGSAVMGVYENHWGPFQVMEPSFTEKNGKPKGE